MDSSVERMLRYCTGIASEFEARLNRVRAFVPNHNPTAGAANEIILRDFLANLSTGRYKVGQGFICDPTASDRVSKQCDILVYNHHQYPLVYSEGGIQIVYPQAVKMLIEVKTGLDDLASAVDNIRAAKEMNFLLNGVIFAFQSPREETVIKNFQECLKGVPARFWPMAVLLLDRGVIIHRWPGTELGGGESLYTVCISKERDSAVVVAFLLLLFFDISMQNTWGGAGILNMGHALLTQKTDTIVEGLGTDSA